MLSLVESESPVFSILDNPANGLIERLGRFHQNKVLLIDPIKAAVDIVGAEYGYCLRHPSRTHNGEAEKMARALKVSQFGDYNPLRGSVLHIARLVNKTEYPTPEIEYQVKALRSLASMLPYRSKSSQ